MSAIHTMVMRRCSNFFANGYLKREWAVSEGKIDSGSVLEAGMWVAVTGSMYHNGVWELGANLALKELPDGTPDETFTGKVWILTPPPDFLDLCEQIGAYDASNPHGTGGSVTIGSYSESGAADGWEQAFRNALIPYTRSTLVNEVVL